MGEKDVLTNILGKNCYTKLNLNEIVDIQILKSCKDFDIY